MDSIAPAMGAVKSEVFSSIARFQCAFQCASALNSSITGRASISIHIHPFCYIFYMPAFTDAALRRLTPRDRAYRVFERGALAGFGIVVSPGGGKTFFLQHTRQGDRRFYRLGAYPALPLAAAREKARQLLAQLEQGLDPRAAPVTPASGTLEALLIAWLTHQHGLERRRLDDTERLLRANLPAALLARPAVSIQPADIRAVLAAVHQRGARVLANRLRAHLHSLFAYGLKADHDPRRLSDPILFGLTLNPVSAIPRDAGAEHPGERVLTWGEVRAVWQCDRLTWPARQAVRLLLLTGARVNEVCQAAWAEFDLDAGVWTLPSARAKNHRAALTPLTPLMMETLGELRAVFADSAWLFPARNSVSAAAPWGSTALSHAVRKAGMDWRPQDLRRTFKTLAAGAGIDRAILDKIQNHAMDANVGSKHYDRYSYQREKGIALQQWETELRARLAGDNVVVLPVRRANTRKP